MTADGTLLDVNALVALVWPQHIHHARAQAWFGAHAGPWYTSPITESGLVRLSLDPAVVGMTVSAADVLALLAELQRLPGHRFLTDDASLVHTVIGLDRFAAGHQVTDLHLVGLCARNDLVLSTFDRRIRDMLQPEDRRHVELIP